MIFHIKTITFLTTSRFHFIGGFIIGLAKIKFATLPFYPSIPIFLLWGTRKGLQGNMSSSYYLGDSAVRTWLLCTLLTSNDISVAVHHWLCLFGNLILQKKLVKSFCVVSWQQHQLLCKRLSWW